MHAAGMGWNSSVLGGSVQESAVHIAGIGVSVVVSIAHLVRRALRNNNILRYGTQGYSAVRASQASSPLAENRTDRPRWGVKGHTGALA